MEKASAGLPHLREQKLRYTCKMPYLPTKKQPKAAFLLLLEHIRHADHRNIAHLIERAFQPHSRLVMQAAVPQILMTKWGSTTLSI